jgi:asparagine synthase (glutamine-hydrolysing)
MRTMRAALAHRGPDGEGEFASRHVTLGMRRLSIIDVHGGWQPLYNEDRSLALVANGEIYNFVELRAELEAKGHRFGTGSDCETILHLYEEHGLGCVDHLRGMFAFALWDLSCGRLLLARDRMGEKPLYVYKSDREILFASELKALLSTDRVPFELDPSAVDLYFHYQYVPEPRTPVAGVRKLPPGHLMTVDIGSWKVTERRYWRMEDAPPVAGDPAEEIRTELATVGRLVSRSDVPIGVALSGGIDSSAMAALITRNSTGPVHAFSVGYEGRPANDERSEAKELASVLGMEFHEIELDSTSVVDSFPELVRSWDDPIADMSGFCYRAIARLTHDHGIKVIVQGQGGDELFWGYPWVRRAMSASLRRTALWRKGRAAFLDYLTSDLSAHDSPMEEGELLPPWTRARRALEQLRKDSEAPRGQLAFYDLHPDFGAAHAAVRDFYTREFRSQLEPAGPFSLFTISLPRDHLGVDLTRLIAQTYLLENGIAQGDRLTMASSVELRLPLVDYRLVEKVIGLRKSYPDHEEPPKAWLREAVRDLLPEANVGRKKRPFLTPLRAWHRKLFDAYGALLEDGHLVELGVLSPEVASHLAEGHFPPNAGSTLSFKALVLELWCRTMRQPEQTISPGRPAKVGGQR